MQIQRSWGKSEMRPGRACESGLRRPLGAMLRMLSFLLSVKYKKLPKVWAWKEHNQVQSLKFSDCGVENREARRPRLQRTK